MAMVPHERSLVKRLESKPFALLGVDLDDTPEKMPQGGGGKEDHLAFLVQRPQGPDRQAIQHHGIADDLRPGWERGDPLQERGRQGDGRGRGDVAEGVARQRDEITLS
jgi:hypothetical protein